MTNVFEWVTPLKTPVKRVIGRHNKSIQSFFIFTRRLVKAGLIQMFIFVPFFVIKFAMNEEDSIK